MHLHLLSTTSRIPPTLCHARVNSGALFGGNGSPLQRARGEPPDQRGAKRQHEENHWHGHTTANPAREPQCNFLLPPAKFIIATGPGFAWELVTMRGNRNSVQVKVHGRRHAARRPG